jgi:hypothetical protein
MPLSDDCGPLDLCCTTLYDIAEHLLNSTYTAMRECYPSAAACPMDSWRKYVTMGSGDDGVDDALTVAFTLAAPRTQGAITSPLAMYTAAFEVRLRERGWPTAWVETGGQIHAPDWTLASGKARQALAHGEKMYRHLIWLNNARGLTPASVPGCSNTQLGPLTPLPPLGGVVGFTVQLTMNVPWSGG